MVTGVWVTGIHRPSVSDYTCVCFEWSYWHSISNATSGQDTCSQCSMPALPRSCQQIVLWEPREAQARRKIGTTWAWKTPAIGPSSTASPPTQHSCAQTCSSCSSHYSTNFSSMVTTTWDLIWTPALLNPPHKTQILIQGERICHIWSRKDLLQESDRYNQNCICHRGGRGPSSRRAEVGRGRVSR